MAQNINNTENMNNVSNTKQNVVEAAIRKTAKDKLSGIYNLQSYQEGQKNYPKKQAAMLHKRVCEEITAFADAHPTIPMYIILSVGVSKGAYKQSEFAKGYKRFNAAKVEAIAEMVSLYSEYNGLNPKKASDVAWRLIMRYYERVSTDVEAFKVSLAASEKLGREATKRGNYDKLCKNLGIEAPSEKKPKEQTPTADEAMEALLGEVKAA